MSTSPVVVRRHRPPARSDPPAARRPEPEPIELLPPAWVGPRRRTSRPFPWRVFPAVAVAGVGLHYALRVHPLLFIAAACAGIMALTWWLLRWIDVGPEHTKRERGW